MAGIATTEVFR